jgi:hypothetical protein
MVDVLTTKYSPQGAGAQLAFLTKPEDDSLFYGDANDNTVKSQFHQSMEKITWHANAMMIYPFANSGAGKTQTADISRTPDFMGKCWDLTYWPGLGANTSQGVKRSYYVNARGLAQYVNLSVKVGSQPLFENDPIRMLLIMDMLGLTKHYKENIGLHYTLDSLIEDSSVPSITITPFAGFPFQIHLQQALNVGTFVAHKLTCCKQTQPLNKLVLNEVTVKGRGAFYMPIDVSTDQIITADSIQSIMAAECYWVTKPERTSITSQYREVFYKEWKVGGTQTFEPATKSKEVSFEVSTQGLLHQVFLMLQFQDDIDNLNWMKCCDDNGNDMARDAMFYVSDKPREDGLPIKFYRTVRVSEAFKVKQKRHIYLLFNADVNPLNVTQNTGGQGMGDVNKCKININLLPHTKAITATAIIVETNAFYTEKTSGFRVWG